MPRVKNQLRGSFRRSFRNPSSFDGAANNANSSDTASPSTEAGSMHRHRRRRSSVAVVNSSHSGGSMSAAVYAAERRSSLTASAGGYVSSPISIARHHQQQQFAAASPSRVSLHGSSSGTMRQTQPQQQHVSPRSLSPSPSEYYELGSIAEGRPHLHHQLYRFSSHQPQQQRQQLPLHLQLSGSASGMSATSILGAASTVFATPILMSSRRTSAGGSSSCTVDALRQQSITSNTTTAPLPQHRAVLRRKSSVAHQQLFQTALSIKDQQRKPDILWRYDDDNIGWYITYGDGDAVTLLHTKRERIQMKNYATEIRALQDMEKFLYDATILLDVDEFQAFDKILLSLSKTMLTSPKPAANMDNECNITTTLTTSNNNLNADLIINVSETNPSDLDDDAEPKQQARIKNPTQLLFRAQKDTTTTLLNVVSSTPTHFDAPSSPPNGNNSGTIKRALQRARSNTLAVGAATLSLLQAPGFDHGGIDTSLPASRRTSASIFPTRAMQNLPTIAFGSSGGGGVDGEPSVEQLMKEVEATLFAHDEAGELARQIQGVVVSSEGVFQGYDQAWICVMCNLPSLQRRRLGLVRLRRPANFGTTCQECQYIILVFAPLHEKATKTALETGRTFSTLFADMLFRHELLYTKSVGEFREKIRRQAELLAEIHAQAFGEGEENEENEDELDDHFFVTTNNRSAPDLSSFYGPESNLNVLGSGASTAGRVIHDSLEKIASDLSRKHESGHEPTLTAAPPVTLRSHSAASSKQRRPKPSFCELLDMRPFKGLQSDLFNRLRFYADDFRDGFRGSNTVQKTISTTCFLYFACLLPTIAFGTLHHSITNGQLGVRKAIIAQAAGGLVFSILGGQPLVVLLTTAPLALYIKVIFNVAEDLNVGFLPFYGCVGLWNALLLIIYAVSGGCQLMKWSTRSTEEIFAVFVSITFVYDAFKAINESKSLREKFFCRKPKNIICNQIRIYRPAAHTDFQENYYSAACETAHGASNKSAVLPTGSSLLPSSSTEENLFSSNYYDVQIADSVLREASNSSVASGHFQCRQDASLLYLLLLVGTALISLWLYTFNKTPYLGKKKRELLTDYSLPLAVVVMSFIGSFVFRRVDQNSILSAIGADAAPVALNELSWSSIFIAFGLSVPLSLLFYIDQNVSSAMVNSPVNKLRKPPAYHLDLLVVGFINAMLSYFGLPWLHGALPHSPMHVHCLAELEQRVEDGHVFEIVIRVRETRVTTLISHLFIALSIFLLPYPLAYIPPAVLNGLFLYMAFTALNNLDLWDRICSCLYEKRLLPPQTYYRHVPLFKINLFTTLQLLQLGLLCAAGFAPVAYAKMCFPVLIMVLIPIRQNLIPKIIEPKYLTCLDGHNV